MKTRTHVHKHKHMHIYLFIRLFICLCIFIYALYIYIYVYIPRRQNRTNSHSPCSDSFPCLNISPEFGLLILALTSFSSNRNVSRLLPIYLRTSTYPPTYSPLHTYLPACLPTHPPTYLHIDRPERPPYPCTYLPPYRDLPTYLATACLPNYLSRVVLFRLALSWLVQVLTSVASAAFSGKCSAVLWFQRHSNSLAQLAFLEVESTCLWQRWMLAPSDACRKPDVTRWVAMDARPIRCF